MGSEPAAGTGGGRGRDGRVALVSVAYALSVVVYALHVVALSYDERIGEIFLDEWLNLFRREEYSLLRWLFDFHNAHLIPATRVLLALDYDYLSARGLLPWLASLLCTGVTVVVLLRLLRASGTLDRSTRRTLGAFFSFCLLWTGLFYGYLWGFSVHAPMTTMWLVLSIACFVALATREEIGPAEGARWLAALGLVSAFLATLSYAAGVAAWAALLGIAIAARLAPGLIVAIVLAGFGSGVLLAQAPMHAGSAGEILGSWLGDAGKVPTFVLSFIGVPVGWTARGLFTLSDAALGRICFSAGCVGVAGLVLTAARAVRGPPTRDPLVLLGLALMSYGAAAATLAGLGRASHFGAVFARFTPVAMVFWLGAVSVLAAQMAARGRVGRRLLVGLLPVASLAMLPAPAGHLEKHRWQKASASTASLRILVGIRDRSVIESLTRRTHLPPESPQAIWAVEAVKRTLPMLEREGRGPFADPRRELLGRPFEELYAVSPPCSGRIDRWQELDSEGAAAAMLQGEIRETPDGLSAVSLIVVDPAGSIRGLGNLLPPRDDRAAWVAFVGAHESDRRHDVHAVLGDGSVCLLDRHLPGKRGAARERSQRAPATGSPR